MFHGICHLSSLVLRRAPDHRSEMVSQLLFGELYTIQQRENEWTEVCCCYDQYSGWLMTSQLNELTEKEYGLIKKQSVSVVIDLLSMTSSPARSFPILAGSSLFNFDGINYSLGKSKFVFNGQAVVPSFSNFANQLEKIALRYLEAPYLWGGRSPLGIDCSGFSQMVYKYFGLPLPRDAWQQAEQGIIVHFVEESQPGDLAFFHNDEGRITHVGIILSDRRIIHASSKVRIDTLDHFGIFQAESKKYTHQLKIIKRMC
jgi:cell wall-associated NlpC family hydrolase